VTDFDAQTLDAYYLEPYKMLNPPPTPISPEETLLKHPAGNIYVAFGDVSGGMIGYRNKHGGFCPNLALPAKQSITGWLSPEGFIFACDHYGHGLIARAVVESLGLLQGATTDYEIVLEDEGWLKVRHSAPIWSDPNEKQAEVLLALLGA